jgi:energy-coupling factor transport system substrate-specific component
VYCQTCGAAHRGRASLCDECKKTLSGLPKPGNVPAPGGGLDADQDLIASGYRKPLSKEGGWNRPELVRTNVIPVALGGRFLKRGWLTAFGAAGLMANIGEMAFRWGIWWFWLIIPSGFAFFIGYALIRKGFVRFADLINFEADQAGRVYLTTIGGDCPVCNAEIKLKDIGPKREVKTVIQCTAESTHQWGFDPKRLDAL